MNGSIFLIRHAQAGDRRHWEDLDLLRPLNRAGSRQAEALVGLLGEAAITRLVSSPYVRCVQTLEPVAADRGLPIEIADELAEGTLTERAITLLERVEPGAALCSHGDVIEGSLAAFRRRGMVADGRFESAKGSVWELRREHGAIVSGRYLPPP